MATIRLHQLYVAQLNNIDVPKKEVTRERLHVLFELCAGFKRFSDDIAMMIGHRPNYYWLVCWVVLTPAMTWVNDG